MQTILVIIVFALALGFLLKKFIYVPVMETRRKTTHTLDGDRTKCGNKNCGCQ